MINATLLYKHLIKFSTDIVIKENLLEKVALLPPGEKLGRKQSLGEYYNQQILHTLFKIGELFDKISNQNRKIIECHVDIIDIEKKYVEIKEYIEYYNILLATYKDIILKLINDIFFLGLRPKDINYIIISNVFWVNHYKVLPHIKKLNTLLEKNVKHRNLTIHEYDEYFLEDVFDPALLDILRQIIYPVAKELYSPIIPNIAEIFNKEIKTYGTILEKQITQIDQTTDELVEYLFTIYNVLPFHNYV
jgi:hypothetical protein